MKEQYLLETDKIIYKFWSDNEHLYLHPLDNMRKLKKKGKNNILLFKTSDYLMNYRPTQSIRKNVVSLTVNPR